MKKDIKQNRFVTIAAAVIVSIFIIGGIGVWAEYNYSNAFNHQSVQDKNSDEIRQEYLKVLYNNEELTENKAREIIIMNDSKEKHGDFTESRPEKFIKGIIKSYKVDGKSIVLDISDEDGNTYEKLYDYNQLLIVNISEEKASKLKIADNNVADEDGSHIELENRTIYIIVNDVNDAGLDDIFII